MNTTPENLEITATTAAGNTYAVVSYVDPFPGRKGSDVLKSVCGKCHGDKVIHYGGLTLQANGVSGRVCFECMGRGFTTRLVSSARQTARRQAAAQTAANAAAADYVNTEVEDAHTEALEEEARRAALVTGFLAEEGVRVRNIKAVVEVNAKFESVSFNGYGVDYKSMLILREVESGKVIKVVTGSRGLERGETVTVSGTVKAHASYHGQDQTVLGRPIIK